MALWIKAVLDIGMDVVIRVKAERLNIVKDAMGLFKNRKADNEWEVNKNFKVKVWDEDCFEIIGLNRDLKFLRFVEYITKGRGVKQVPENTGIRLKGCVIWKKSGRENG